MNYSVQIKESAAKELSQIRYEDRVCIVRAIDGLAENPFVGATLKGELRGLRRLRVGNYRVVYEVLEDALVVLVVRAGHRRQVYRGR